MAVHIRDPRLTSTRAAHSLRRTPDSGISPSDTILALQRLAGNSAVTAVLQRSRTATAKPFKKEHYPLSTDPVVIVKERKPTKKQPQGMAKVEADPSTFAAEILDDAKLPANWFDSFTSGGTFLGWTIRDPIHTDLAEHLRTVETDLAKTYGGPDCDPVIAGRALGLTEEIIGSRDHPTSAKISMHLFGLAVDLNYTANPMINRGSEEQAIFKRAGQLVNGSPATYTPGMSYDEIAALDAIITKYFSYLDESKEAELKKRIEASTVSKWQGMEVADARTLIQSDVDTITGLWERRKSTDQISLIQAGGFLDLKKELVKGMKMSWGGQEYGDMMHFDLRDQGNGQKIHEAIGRYNTRKAEESKQAWTAAHPS